MRLAAILALLVIASYALAADSDIPTALEKLADSSSRVVLYSLEPMMNEGVSPDKAFHGYPVRGRADITDANERRALLRALAHGAREAAPNIEMACFNPRHGLRVEQGSYAADFVICFECLQVQGCGFQPTESFHTSATPQATFDESLRHHDLPLLAPHQ